MLIIHIYTTLANYLQAVYCLYYRYAHAPQTAYCHKTGTVSASLNRGCTTCFSLITAKNNPSCNDLHLDGTLFCVLTVKMNSFEPCYRYVLPKELDHKPKYITPE